MAGFLWEGGKSLYLVTLSTERFWFCIVTIQRPWYLNFIQEHAGNLRYQRYRCRNDMVM